MPIKRCPGFYCSFFLYRYGVRRSGYRRISWLSTWSQFRYLCVHFFVTFPLARYSIFSSALSLGNTLFVFVTFRYWRFSPSMMFVVYMIRRISPENWKKELTSSQLFSQLLIAYGYFFPHFSFTASSSARAAASVGAL